MYKHNRKNKINNKGSITLMAMIAIGVVTVFASIMLYLARNMASSNKISIDNKKTFTSCEQALTQIYDGIGLDVDDCMKEAYKQVADKGNDKISLFRLCTYMFYNKISETDIYNFNSIAVDRIKYNNDNGDVLKYINSKIFDSSYVSHSNIKENFPKAVSVDYIEYYKNSNSITIKNLTVQSIDIENVISTITTDIVINCPNYNPVSNLVSKGFIIGKSDLLKFNINTADEFFRFVTKYNGNIMNKLTGSFKEFWLNKNNNKSLNKSFIRNINDKESKNVLILVSGESKLTYEKDKSMYKITISDDKNKEQSYEIGKDSIIISNGKISLDYNSMNNGSFTGLIVSKEIDDETSTREKKFYNPDVENIKQSLYYLKYQRNEDGTDSSKAQIMTGWKEFCDLFIANFNDNYTRKNFDLTSVDNGEVGYANNLIPDYTNYIKYRNFTVS